MPTENQDERFNAMGGDGNTSSDFDADSDVENGLELPDQDGDDPIADDEELQKRLYSLYIKCCGEDRYARLVEVKDVKRAEFYWGSRQYIWWSNQDNAYKLPSQAQGVNYGDINIDDMPRFEFVTNIYQSRGLGVIGAVAGVPPRYRFFPNDATDDNDLETAEGRTKEARLIWRWNPVQKLLQDEVYHAYTGGFIAYHTRYVSDGAKYGTDSLALLGIADDIPQETITCSECGWTSPADQAEPPVPCPVCGTFLTVDDIAEDISVPVPTDEGEQQVARGRIVISVFGALNCKRPQHVQEQSQYHYFAIEDEVHYSTLRAAFPSKSSDIRPGMSNGADDVYERNARLSVAENTKALNQTGAAQANLCTHARVWFRPSAFYMLDDEGSASSSQSRQAETSDGDNDRDDEDSDLNKLLKAFPRGCRVEFCGSTYLTSRAESMDDCVVTTHAMPGRGQHRPAIGTSLLSVQDRINTFSNIEAETYEYGIPITYRASDTFNSDANEDQRAAPGLEIEVQLDKGADLRSRIFQVRADSVSPTMQQHMAQLFGPVADELVGTYPAVTGAASDTTPETLGQHAMQRDQAMGRMGVFYVNLKQAHADVTTQACVILEENEQGELKVPVLGASGDFESESIDITALTGEAQAYPEGDESFPELWNQQRVQMKEIMDSPYGEELIKDPENAELFLKLVGIPGLKSPVQDSWRKQLKEISELTRIPEGDELLTGIAPMVAVDPLNDRHQIEADSCAWWLNSPKGQGVKRVNPLGWQAVSAHRQQHMQAIPKPEPPAKPLSETLTTNFKDMPPEAQAQLLEKLGIHVTPQDFMDKLAMDKALKPASKPGAGPGKPPKGDKGDK